VVPSIADENESHGTVGKLGVVGFGENGNDLREIFLAGPLGEVADERRLDVHRVDLPGRAHGSSEANREVPGSRPEVGHHGPLLHPQELDDLLGLLPGVALGIVEDSSPALGILEPVSRAGLVGAAGGRDRPAEPQGEQDRGSEKTPDQRRFPPDRRTSICRNRPAFNEGDPRGPDRL